MSFTFNRVTLVGRAGATPELRALADGRSVLTLSLATDRPGNPGTPSATDWHRVTCYERLAEVAAEHVTKGPGRLPRGSARVSLLGRPPGSEAHHSGNRRPRADRARPIAAPGFPGSE